MKKIIFIILAWCLFPGISLAIELDADSDGALDAERGGTGNTTWAQYAVPYWSAATGSNGAGVMGAITGVTSNGSLLFFGDDVQLCFGNTAGTPDACIEWDTAPATDILYVNTGADFNGTVSADVFSTGPSDTPTMSFDDGNDTGTNADAAIVINCPTTNDCDMDFQVNSGADSLTSVIHIDTADAGTTEVQIGGSSNYTAIDESGNVTLTGTATMTAANAVTFQDAELELPNTAADKALATAGEFNFNTTDEQLSFHSAADGEISGEVAISLIQHSCLNFDPSTAYDNSPTYRTQPLFYIGDDFPEGLTITEWRLRYINGDPTTELDADLMCDTTPDFNPAAGATVMDAIDTTAGSSAADTGFDSASCANASQLYIRLNADPTDANVIISFDLWYYAEED